MGSTRDVGESPPEEVFANEADIGSSRNEDDSPREVCAEKVCDIRFEEERNENSLSGLQDAHSSDE